MKKKMNKVIVVILLIAGLSLLLYPFTANQWNNYRQKKLIGSYEQTVADREQAGEIDYKGDREAAMGNNTALLPSILPDSFAIAEASEEDAEYMSCLNIAGDSMMGTVEIPKIDITIPVYHTTDDEVLQIAAGHLEGSSLPVGGADTHAVISAHRGLPSAALFTDLDKLGKTDHFLLHILDETLCYEVDRITVVEPKDTKDLQVEDGKDLVTLMTCTPYGVNSHRLLVRGHRVPYTEELADEKLPLSNMSLHTSYLLWAVTGIAVAAGFSFFLYRREKKLAKKMQKKENAVCRVKQPEPPAQENNPEETEIPEEPAALEKAEIPEEPVASEETEILEEPAVSEEAEPPGEITEPEMSEEAAVQGQQESPEEVTEPEQAGEGERP